MPETKVETNRWALVVHGGAKTIAPNLQDRNRQGCLAAVEAGATVLKYGGCAVAAVEAAIRKLEDDPIFNAGFGSVLNAEGRVEMDAAIMDGAKLAAGAVAGVSRLRNPIGAARALIDARPVLLAGEGAEEFALAKGMEYCDPEAMIAPERLASEYSKAHDTVGCVAIDMQGHIAAGTSTGGLPGKHKGRIGDSPILGCGLYADDLVGGVSFSGDGERILRGMLAARVMRALDDSLPSAAAASSLDILRRIGGEAGAIVIDAAGRIGIAHNSDNFAIALHASWIDAPQAAVHHDDLKGWLDA